VAVPQVAVRIEPRPVANRRYGPGRRLGERQPGRDAGAQRELVKPGTGRGRIRAPDGVGAVARDELLGVALHGEWEERSRQVDAGVTDARDLEIAEDAARLKGSVHGVRGRRTHRLDASRQALGRPQPLAARVPDDPL